MAHRQVHRIERVDQGTCPYDPAVRLIAKDLIAVAEGRYDWRIERFMRNNGITRTP